MSNWNDYQDSLANIVSLQQQKQDLQDQCTDLDAQIATLDTQIAAAEASRDTALLALEAEVANEKANLGL